MNGFSGYVDLAANHGYVDLATNHGYDVGRNLHVAAHGNILQLVEAGLRHPLSE